MGTNFPTSLDAHPSAATLSGHTLGTDPHSTLHGDLGLAVDALEAKVGVDGSAVTTTVDYMIKHGVNPSTQAIGDALSQGTVNTVARADHKHQMPTAADINALAQSINAQTGTTYTLVAGDAGKLVTLSNASAITLTVPQDSDATWAVGVWVEGFQLGAGQVTVVAGTGATLRATPGAKARAQYSRFFLQKISANTWALSGDISA